MTSVRSVPGFFSSLLGGAQQRPDHIKEMVGLRQRGWCDLAVLITHRMWLSEVQAAYDIHEQR